MTWRQVVLFVTLVAALLGSSVQGAQTRADVELRAAMEQETVSGDLQGAIKSYQAIVVAHAANRPIVAKALLRLADCYRKLGHAEATSIYERIVRDYGDQPNAVSAARVALTARLLPTEARRLVWSLPREASVYARVSRDGRYLPFADFFTASLYVRDLSTGLDRLVAAASPPAGGSGEAALSRDGRQLAYRWWTGDTGRSELRVMPLHGARATTFRVLVQREEVLSVTPYDWSPDGAFIAVQITRPDTTTQIALVAAATGSIRVLKSVDWRGATGMAFSPDGRYLGYDVVTPGGTSRDVFVVAVDGANEAPVAQSSSDDVFIDWSPDGRQLLFSSDRNGPWSLWAAPVGDGKVHGEAQLIDRDFGPVTSLGISTDGDLFTLRDLGIHSELKTARFDFAVGKLSSPLDLAAPQTGARPAAGGWSPDGQRLAYVVRAERPGLPGSLLAIRDEASRKSRVFPLALERQLGDLKWSRDSQFLLASGTDVNRRQGIFKIDAATGEMTRIVTAGSDMRLSPPSLSTDGTKLYFRQNHASATDGPLVERDLATNQDRIVFEGDGRIEDIRVTDDRTRLYYTQVLPSGRQPARERILMTRDLRDGTERELMRGRDLQALLSPDQRHIAVSVSPLSADAGRVLLFIPTDGGAAREVMRVPKGESIVMGVWAPNSESLIVQTVTGPPPSVPVALWWVRRDGLQVHRIDGAPVNVSASSIGVHPDGQQIVFRTNPPNQPAEVWVRENVFKRVSPQ